MAKGKTVTKEKLDDSTTARLAAFYSEELDYIDKKERLFSGFSDLKRVSTGNLVMDLMTGGGLVSGWYSISGPEQSAKSTLAMTILGESLKYPFLSRKYHDPENAMVPDYTRRVMSIKNHRTVFGQRDEKKGTWIIPPKIRYYDDNQVEATFNSIRATLKSLPTKIYRPEKKQWYLVFRNKQEEKDRMKKLKLEHSKSLFTETGQYWCPIDDSSLQAIFVIDSLPSLTPEDVDEGKKSGDGLALLAREFSKHVPRVKGLLRRKAAIIIVVNQLRKAPMARGNPEYEPCGEAVKYWSDCRMVMRPRVPPETGGWTRDPDDGGTCIEDSVEYDGSDSYHFKGISNIKNKLGRPRMKGWCRVWVSDGRGKARGIDPVFDTLEYLRMTGQIQIETKRGKGRFITFISDDFKPLAKAMDFDYRRFKQAILAEISGDKKELERVCLKGGAKEAVKIRRECFRQVEKGKSMDLYNDNLLRRYKSKGSDGDDLEDMDDEDDDE